MRKIRDRTVVRWLYKGKEFDEEIIFYKNDDDENDDDDEDTSIKGGRPADSSLDVQRHTVPYVNTTPQYQMMLILLNNCLERFAILKCIARKNQKPLVFMNVDYLTIEERFGEKIEYGQEFYSEDKKRYEDLTLIFTTLYKTLHEVVKNGTFLTVLDDANVLKRLRKEEQQLEYHDANSKKEEAEIKLLLHTQLEKLEARYAGKLEELRVLELAHEDAYGYGNLEVTYTDKWEATRREQCEAVIENTLNSHKDTISSNQIKIDLENRIHSEIMAFLEETNEEMQNDIEYWVEKYEDEIETRDENLYKLKINRDNQMGAIEKLREQYEEQKEFIDYWHNIKMERKAAEDLYRRQIAAAIKIQAWWRGIMVRRKLYKSMRKKKKKKKGAGKGKKVTFPKTPKRRR